MPAAGTEAQLARGCDTAEPFLTVIDSSLPGQGHVIHLQCWGKEEVEADPCEPHLLGHESSPQW